MTSQVTESSTSQEPELNGNAKAQPKRKTKGKEHVRRFTGAQPALRPLVQSVAEDIPDSTISGCSEGSANTMEDQVAMLVILIVEHTNAVLGYTEAKTLTITQITRATELSVTQELAGEIVRAGEKAFKNFNDAKKEEKKAKEEAKKEGKSSDGEKKKETASHRAKLKLPVARVEKYLRQKLFADRLTSGAAAFVTGCAEYLLREVIHNSVQFSTLNEDRKILTVHNIAEAIADCPKLARLLGENNIRGASTPGRWNPEWMSQNGRKTDEQLAAEKIKRQERKEQKKKEGGGKGVKKEGGEKGKKGKKAQENGASSASPSKKRKGAPSKATSTAAGKKPKKEKK